MFILALILGTDAFGFSGKAPRAHYANEIARHFSRSRVPGKQRHYGVANAEAQA